MREFTGLSYEKNKKYRFAINSGYFDTWEEDPRQWKHTFAGAFIWKHHDRVMIVDLLKSFVGHIPQWEDLTDDVLRDLVDELMDGSRKQSSVRTMCAELKAILNANKRKIPSEDYMNILTIKNVASQAVYLTKAEVELFLSYRCITPLEHYVHHCFCIELLTGARLVDASRLTVHNCDIDTNMLSYVPQKTPGIVVNVPVDERHGLRTILADVPQRKECSRDTFNDTARRICRELGINTICTINNVTAEKWKFVSSHTARRSFATNLYLAGISIEDIALMMGHGKNIETTKRYICAERTLNPSVMSYFQPQPQPQPQSQSLLVQSGAIS